MTVLLALLALSVGVSIGWQLRGTLDAASAQVRRDHQFALRHPATAPRSIPGSLDWEQEQDALYRQHNQGWPG